MSEKALLVGPRTHSAPSGVRIGFELLVAEFSRRALPHTVVDLGVGGSAAHSGSLHPGRTAISAVALAAFWFKLVRVRRVYMTISLSRLGFLRDALMIWPTRLLRRRLVLQLHGGGYDDFYHRQPDWLKRLIRLTLAQADVILVLGELLRGQFSFVPGADRKVRVLPNGLPLELRPEDRHPKSLPVTGTIRLLYLSNMIESKGYLEVLSACRILAEEYGLPIHCDFCGEFLAPWVGAKSPPPQQAKEKFLGLIKDWNLEDLVTFHGIVAGETKQRILSEAHIFILPTSYPWEGQPISIIEALAFGTPVIATRFRGIPEQVVDGYNGFFVEANSPTQIAQAVRRMARDPVLYQQLSRNAIQHYLANFTREVHLQRLTSIILGSEQGNFNNLAAH